MNSIFDEGLQKESLEESINRIVKEIIASRSNDFSGNLKEYLNPRYYQIRDTHKAFKFVNDITGRINIAISENKRITVHGDFDADGLTATAIIVEFFKYYGFENYNVHIPDRLTTGHGMQVDTVEKLAKDGTDMIITVDCGIDAVEPVKKANELGVTVIVTDHHIAGEQLPDCLIFKAPDKLNTPFSGAGIAFKLVQALCSSQSKDGKYEDGKSALMSKLLQLAMLGTVVDSVPQIGENRIISKLGFDEISENPCIGLSSITTQLGLDKVRSEDITYGIAPRLSAASRFGEPLTAYNLLVTEDVLEAFHLQKKLTELNDLRKSLVKAILKDIVVDVRKPAISIVVEGNAKGVTGLIASKLVDKHGKPAFVCAKGSDNFLHCSARSGGYCDLSEAFDFVSNVIESGGGHKHAGGAVLTEENFPDFSMKLNTFMRSIHAKEGIDKKQVAIRSIALPLNLVGKKLLDEIRKFEPYGPAGLPIFHSFVVAGQTRLIGKEKDHLEMRVCCTDSKAEVRSLGWNMGNQYYNITRRNELDPFEIKYTIAENNFRGKTSYELHLIDIDFHGTEIPF